MLNESIKFENLDDLGCIELTDEEAASLQGGMTILDPICPTKPTPEPTPEPPINWPFNCDWGKDPYCPVIL